MISVTKSNVSVASRLTRSTILATLYLARNDFTNVSHVVCFCSANDLKCVKIISLENIR